MKYGMKLMWKVALAILLLAATPTWAAAERNGFYVGMELGIALSPDVSISGQDNDFKGSSTTCDGFIGGDPSLPACADRGNVWSNDFGGANGVLAGAALGYRFGGFRFEGEYFHRDHGYDEENEPSLGGVSPDKISELIGADGAFDASVKIGGLTSHNFFLNVYRDFPVGPDFTFYVGAGAGWSNAALDYSARFTRAPIAANGAVAGTTTVANETFEDTLMGWQVLLGVDYPFSERVSMGLKFRWADYGKFEIGGKQWDRLRSHPSFTAPGGTPILYDVEMDNVRSWGLSLVMKYSF